MIFGLKILSVSISQFVNIIVYLTKKFLVIFLKKNLFFKGYFSNNDWWKAWIMYLLLTLSLKELTIQLNTFPPRQNSNLLR